MVCIRLGYIKLKLGSVCFDKKGAVSGFLAGWNNNVAATLDIAECVTVDLCDLFGIDDNGF